MLARNLPSWSLLLAVGVHLAAPGEASAQSESRASGAGATPSAAADSAGLFPPDVFFPAPHAGSGEPRLVAAYISTDVLIEDPGGEREPFDPGTDDAERQVLVGLGETIPLARFALWPGGGVSISLQGGVFARFRIERTTNDLLASDWILALPIAARRGPFEARLRLLHWSSHLGDEFAESSGAARVGFGYDAVEVLAAYRIGPARVYGGGNVVLRSEADDGERELRDGIEDDLSVQAGLDVRWRPWHEGRLGLVGGVDWERQERTDWRDQLTVSAAVELARGEGSRGSGSLGLRFGHGPSRMGEFFLTEETYWGVELRFGL